VSGEEFDGLMIEFRFSAGDTRNRGRSTLVLVGEMRSGSFVLKSTRRVGHSKWDDELASFNAWPDESAFFTALEAFRSSGTVPERLARNLFPLRGADLTAARVISMLYVPLGKPRLAGIAVRALGFALVLAALCSCGYWSWETGRHLMLAGVAMIAAIVSWLFSFFVRAELRMWRFGYAQLNALYAEFDQESPRLVPLSQSESVRAEADPAVRKYTADLTAAGFVRLGDVRLVPAGIGAVVLRVFAAPDGTTYLALMHQFTNTLEAGKEFHFWPSFTSFVCHTFMRSGGSASSMNGHRHGYRRKRTGPERIARVFPERDDPVAFAQLHAEAAAKFVAEAGDSPVRVARLEEYVRLQNGLAEEERALFADRPYTLGDHLHWYLQIPRREYRR
jgi:hypothetical protein